MDNKLVDIENTGLATAALMRDNNEELNNQRDIVNRVHDKNVNIAKNLQ